MIIAGRSASTPRRPRAERRYLVLTPAMTGADGIAELSRLVVRALGSSTSEAGPSRVDVLSMTDPPGVGAEGGQIPGLRVRGAGGCRLRFVGAAIRAGLGASPGPAVVCLHLHLSPVARLIAARRTPVTTLLIGIEAWKPLRARERLALRRSDLLVSISEHTARRFLAANPDFRDRPLRVCHPGVREQDGWRGAPEPGPRATGLPDEPFALIVGRMATAERYKGHDALIDIWARVSAEVPGARLAVVGDGDDRPRLEAKAARLGGRVLFPGRVPDVSLANFYRHCAFFAMPSRHEGFGLVFLEAMRAGKACIGGAGAASEVIEDGTTGLIVDPEDAGALAQAVLRLFREPGTRERMGQAGAARVRRQFTEAHFRARFRHLLGAASEVW